MAEVYFWAKILSILDKGIFQPEFALGQAQVIDFTLYYFSKKKYPRPKSINILAQSNENPILILDIFQATLLLGDHTDVFIDSDLEGCLNQDVANGKIRTMNVQHSGADAWYPDWFKVYFMGNDLPYTYCKAGMWLDNHDSVDLTCELQYF